MLLLIVVMRNGARHCLIIGIVVVVNIIHMVAVVVILQERAHVRLIVAQVIRRVVSVVVGEMIPVVRRTPVGIRRTAETVEQRRALVEHRLDDIARTIDVRRTNDLNIRCAVAHLHNERSYVLIDISRQHRLDEQYVSTALQGLKHAKVVNIAVVVEVEVGDDIRTGVQDLLKLLDGV